MRQRIHHDPMMNPPTWGFRPRQAAATEALFGQIEALLFAAKRPLSREELLSIFERVGQPLQAAQIDSVLREIQAQYRHPLRGLRLEEVAGGWQFRTRPEYASLLQALFDERPPRLSQAALECLALIAYRQPITRAEIDAVRGVDSSGTLRSLVEKKLIGIVGRSEERRANLYGTTPEFLEFFGLTDLRDLPNILQASFAQPTPSEEATQDEAVATTDEATQDEAVATTDEATQSEAVETTNEATQSEETAPIAQASEENPPPADEIA